MNFIISYLHTFHLTSVLPNEGRETPLWASEGRPGEWESIARGGNETLTVNYKMKIDQSIESKLQGNTYLASKTVGSEIPFAAYLNAPVHSYLVTRS